MVAVNITSKYLIYKDLKHRLVWLFHNVFHRCGKLRGLFLRALNQDIPVWGK